MKVNVIGGGPAGLYFAILYKKAWPQARITVFERNRPDDTFGFGVVFSDQTLETFQNYDLESYRSITENFAYWDDIEIHFKGTVHRIGGNGFCGCSRATLLRAAASARAGARRRAEIPARGHRHRSCNCATPISSSAPTASIRGCARPSRIISSRIRDLRPNKFTWMGSTKPLDAFTFFFKRNQIRHRHRPRLSIRARPLDLDFRDRSGDLREASGLDPHGRGRHREADGRTVRRGIAAATS